MGKISQNTKILMALSSINNLLTAIWEVIRDRIPALSNGKIPVDVELSGVSISLGDAPLQIANDDSNPVPIKDAGGSITVDGTFWQTTQPISAASLPLPTGLPSDLTVSANRLLVDGSGVTQPISVASLPLPSDAATSANQTTANTSLSSIDTKTPELGQALAAASTPVVLPAAQITALTPPTTVNVAPGSAYLSTAPITRAANFTTYTASEPNYDVYGGLFELENIGEAGKGIFLSYFEISLNLSAVPSGMTSFRVYLYPTAPTIIADNSIWTIGSDPVLDPVGFNVSMGLAKGGGKVVGAIRDLNQLFILTTTSLWGYLVTNGAIVPLAASEEGTIRARIFAP